MVKCGNTGWCRLVCVEFKLMIFFISDTHWHHKNVIKYSNRPFSSVDEMNEMLIKNWNNTVSERDVVYHLGDFAFGKKEACGEVLRRLNGHKHLILGNHDKTITKNMNFFMQPKMFESIQTYAEVNHDPKIILFHYGMRVWNCSHYGAIHLYGHSHGSLPPHGLSVDVGVDSKEITDEYRPISLDEVKAYMSIRKQKIVDYHGVQNTEE